MSKSGTFATLAKKRHKREEEDENDENDENDANDAKRAATTTKKKKKTKKTKRENGGALEWKDIVTNNVNADDPSQKPSSSVSNDDDNDVDMKDEEDPPSDAPNDESTIDDLLSAAGIEADDALEEMAEKTTDAPSEEETSDELFNEDIADLTLDDEPPEAVSVERHQTLSASVESIPPTSLPAESTRAAMPSQSLPLLPVPSAWNMVFMFSMMVSCVWKILPSRRSMI